MATSTLKGICRNVLGGAEGSLVQVFETLSRPGSPFLRQDDAFLNAAQWWVPLPEDEGEGGWRLIRLGPSMQAIVTECVYAAPRSGSVPPEGMVGLHFLLDGPVELTGTGPGAKALPPVTMLASHQAPGVRFAVFQPAGVARMLTLCVAPEVLVQSFGLDPRASRVASRLMAPEPGTVSIVEAVMLDSCRALLEALLAEHVGRPGSLAASVGLLLRIVGLAVETLVGDAEETSAGSYSLKDLSLLENTRQALAEDLAENLSLGDIARRLGTNQTKLKAGLRAVYGITASGYRRQCRMERAMELLASEQLPASVVAGMVGYSAHASFTVAFQAYHGITPRAARQRGGALFRPTDRPDPDAPPQARA